MKKKLCKMFGCILFASLVCLLTPSVAKASVKRFPTIAGSTTLSGEVDMDHDGKADSIRVHTFKDSEGYIDHLTVTMNGKTVYTPNVTDLYCYKFDVNYVKMSKSREFIQLLGTGLSDYSEFNRILVYDKQTQKFRCINDFAKLNYEASEIVSASKNKIVLRHCQNISETSWVTWTFPYKYKKGKFVLASSTSKTVKSMMTNAVQNKYTKYYKKGQFVTAKKLTFYKKVNRKNVAFRVPANKAVTLKKLYISKGKYYMQFKYKKKKGWIRVNTKNYNSNKPWFKDIRYAA